MAKRLVEDRFGLSGGLLISRHHAGTAELVGMEVGDTPAGSNRREARLAAGIDHPNFCQVHDVDEVGGIHFFTMPFVEGTPLDHLIGPDRPWPPVQAGEVRSGDLVALPRP